MSLVGKLEDLGLGEILQIVALSGKSGILHVKSRNRIGRVFFHKGKVVSAFSDSYKVSLGEYLVSKGYANRETINRALEKQKATGGKEKLGVILISEFGLPKDKIEECVTELIEKSVFSLFYWTEGEFQFELTDNVKNENITVDFLQYDLSQDRGLNPQFLAMEGTRILDECKKDGTPVEVCAKKISEVEEAESQLEQEKLVDIVDQPKAKSYNPAILFFDEFSVLSNLIKANFPKKGYYIDVTNNIREAKEKLKAFLEKGVETILVTTLIAEKTNGDGILGGMELIELIPKNLDIPIIVTCDYSVPDAEEKLLERNVLFLKKPKRRLLTKENVEREIKFFIQTLEQTLTEIINKKSDTVTINPVLSWEKELKDEFKITESSSSVSTTPGLKLLKSMVLELSKAESGNEIILMILRLASEIMPRAVLFAVKNNRLIGLGQFGLENFLSEPQKTVKNLSLPVTGKIKEVVEQILNYKGAPPEDEVLNSIYQHLGGEKPTEIFLSVIASENRPIVFFYGDNLPHKNNICDTDALEIFFTQAGLAMEKLLSDKK